MGPRGHGKGSTGWLPCEPAFQKSKARVEGFSGQDLESGPPSPHLGRTIKRQGWERAPGAPLACVAAARTGAGGGAVPRRGGTGVRARAEEAAEPGGLAAAVAPPTRVRPALRPPPRVPPASVSGAWGGRGARARAWGRRPRRWARARSREGAGTPAGGRGVGDWAPSAPLYGSACVCIPGAWVVSLGWTSAGGWTRLPLICMSSVYRGCQGVHVPTCLNVPE